MAAPTPVKNRSCWDGNLSGMTPLLEDRPGAYMPQMPA
jgi:hypothetical protein